MIDLGLSKLMLIGVVALVVIGPEKLPKVARMAGSLFGRAQRYLNQVKSEVSREIELDELRNMQRAAQSAATDVEHSITQNIAETRDAFNAGWQDIERHAGPGGDMFSQSAFSNPGVNHAKARRFHQKKLARNNAVPGWYKQRNPRSKSRVISAAARVARYRPASMARSSRSFHF